MGAKTKTIKVKGLKTQEKARQKAQDWIVDGSEYSMGKSIGCGAFATVYLATHVPTGKLCVIKRLDRARRDQMRQVECEIHIMQKASCHPNIVEFKGWYWDEQSIMCMVLGYCAGGSLDRLLASQKENNRALFSEQQIMAWFVQLLSGLNHLHANRIIHRDIKPQNIFLSKDKRMMRLGDLGIAKELDTTNDLVMTCLGTPYYMSPEQMAQRPYTLASDIWALGCVLYEMATRKTAFEAANLPQLLVKIMRNAYEPLPSHFSRPFQQLVGLILRADPDDRPSAARLMMLPLVKSALSDFACKVSSKAPAIASSADNLRMCKTVRETFAGESTARSTANKTTPPNTGRPPSAHRPPTARASARNGAQAAPAEPAPPAIAEQEQEAEEPAEEDGATATGTGKRIKRRTGKRNAVRPEKRVAKAKQWDAALEWELKQAQRAEMRYRAQEYEKRMAREAAKQWRKENEPLGEVTSPKKGADEGTAERIRTCTASAVANAEPQHTTQESVQVGSGGAGDFDWNFTPASRLEACEEDEVPEGLQWATDANMAERLEEAKMGHEICTDGFGWGMHSTRSCQPFDSSEVPEGLELASSSDRGSPSAATNVHAQRTFEESQAAAQADSEPLESLRAGLSASLPVSEAQAASATLDPDSVHEGHDAPPVPAMRVKPADGDVTDLGNRLASLMGKQDVLGIRELVEAIWQQTLLDGGLDIAPTLSATSATAADLLSADDLRILRQNPELLYKSMAPPSGSTRKRNMNHSLPTSSRAGSLAEALSMDQTAPRRSFGAAMDSSTDGAVPLQLPDGEPTFRRHASKAQRRSAAVASSMPALPISYREVEQLTRAAEQADGAEDAIDVTADSGRGAEPTTSIADVALQVAPSLGSLRCHASLTQPAGDEELATLPRRATEDAAGSDTSGCAHGASLITRPGSAAAAAALLRARAAARRASADTSLVLSSSPSVSPTRTASVPAQAPKTTVHFARPACAPKSKLVSTYQGITSSAAAQIHKIAQEHWDGQEVLGDEPELQEMYEAMAKQMHEMEKWQGKLAKRLNKVQGADDAEQRTRGVAGEAGCEDGHPSAHRSDASGSSSEADASSDCSSDEYTSEDDSDEDDSDSSEDASSTGTDDGDPGTFSTRHEGGIEDANEVPDVVNKKCGEDDDDEEDDEDEDDSDEDEVEDDDDDEDEDEDDDDEDVDVTGDQSIVDAETVG